MKRIFILLYVLPILSYAQNPPPVNEVPEFLKHGGIDIKDLIDPFNAENAVLLRSINSSSLDETTNKTTNKRKSPKSNQKTKTQKPKKQGTREFADSLINVMSNLGTAKNTVSEPVSNSSSEPVSNSLSDPYKYSKSYSFDSGDDGSGFTYNRFAKSPCFSKLGFSPYKDRVDLDKEYCDCEREYWTEKIGVGLIILLLLGGVVYMIWLSRGGGKIKLWKKTSNKTTTEEG
jgi:hypothetical protein